MFDHLQNKFSKIFKIVKGHGKITEKNISDSVREIRIALLESDVNFKIVSSFISKVKDKAAGEKVFDSMMDENNIPDGDFEIPINYVNHSENGNILKTAIVNNVSIEVMFSLE